MGRTTSTRRDRTGPAPVPAATPHGPQDGHRETVEAIAVAFILAFLVRGFVAEAFVIPTGSMAPTLMGRHKEITCPQCGYLYAVNASGEVESSSAERLQNHRVIWGTCVNCRYRTEVKDEPSFKGDRILVMKFPYDLPSLPGALGPQRWDVAVFRYPEEPETSYIKRLVGLPGEELRVDAGDIYIKPPGAPEFHLERKPLRHQQAMQMMVYDDTHRAQALQGRPEWRRWSTATPTGWRESAPGVFESATAPGEDVAELRYQHMVPEPAQWEAILNRRALPHPPRPTLITDFYSYNTDASGIEPHWVGDLTLAAQLKVASAQGEVRFELVEGGVTNRCSIDLGKGNASLFHGDLLLGQAPCGIKRAGTYAIDFANVDDRLTLWVDGHPVFGEGKTYDSGSAGHGTPTEADLAPAAVVARGASVTVSDLVLKRDIYYTQSPGSPPSSSEPFELLANPKKYAELESTSTTSYPIGRDRYLMMGDNSPRSKDSRGWSRQDAAWDDSNREYWEVPRALLTGKAFFVYWPHGKLFGPHIRVGLGPDVRVPFRPYLERMKWIR